MLQMILICTSCLTVEPPNNPLAIDDDGDGYTEFDGDCDDRDPDTFPGSVTEATSNECMKDSDGDGFGDSSGWGLFDAGTDCDDSNPLTFPGAAENESDIECLTDEDEDGWSAEVGDCDDEDSSLLGISNDQDCDGVFTPEDCNDDDHTQPTMDQDCDGVLTVDDCDDGDTLKPNMDQDCDGVLSVDDCDDYDPNTVDDMDCDGVLTVDDCDDTDPTSLAQTLDQDCDGVLTVDDCDDFDPLAVDLCMNIGGYSFTAMLIPSGSFTMGCTSEQGNDCLLNENPTQHVALSTNFYLMKSEVTQDVYEYVMGNNPSAFSGSNRPVENVSWFDAVEFANALSVWQGLEECYSFNGGTIHWSNSDCSGWRLPTEAEWEYAARGGQSFKYAGSNSANDVAWYDDNSNEETHDVCGKQSNGYGLCDMSGNVWEWVWDWNASYINSPRVDPRGPISGSDRVLRGGGWHNFEQVVRVSRRNGYDPMYTLNYLGFRLARSN